MNRLKINNIDLSSEEAKSKRQFAGVDIAKFICAILVVSLHTKPFAGVNQTLNHYSTNFLCTIAVPFFFTAGGVLLLKKDII